MIRDRLTLPQPDQTQWHKSTYSGGNNECIEVGSGHSALVPVRDSKHIDGPVLTFGEAAWAAFLGGVKGNSRPLAGSWTTETSDEQAEASWLNGRADEAQAEGTAGSVSLEEMTTQIRSHHRA